MAKVGCHVALVALLAALLPLHVVGITYSVSGTGDVTFNTTRTLVFQNPAMQFTALDVVTVGETMTTCPGMAPGVQVGTVQVNAGEASVEVAFPTAGQFVICYEEQGQAVVPVGGELRVLGATGMAPTSIGLTSETTSMTAITISGIGLGGTDEVKIARGANADCRSSAAVHSTGSTNPLQVAGQTVLYTPVPDVGGQYTVCYRVATTGTPTFHNAIGTLEVEGPYGVSPVSVPVGTFDLVVDGYKLTPGAGGDEMVLVNSATCDSMSAVASSADLTATGGKVRFTGTVNVPGEYTACYRVKSLTASNTNYFQMQQKVTVVGPTDFSPTSAKGGNGNVTLTFTGIGLDSTAVGDSAKLVKGTDCLTDPAVVVSGVPNGPKLLPPDSIGATTLTLPIVLTEGGAYTVCYKATHAGEYRALSPIFEVSGASSFSPSVVPQRWTGDLTFEGALLNAGDKVAVIPSGSSCSSGGTDLAWSVFSPLSGTATISSPETLKNSGTYYVCFTPFDGKVYQMERPLTVTGAQTVSPSELIAGLTEVVSIGGTNLGPSNAIKLVNQTNEQCTAAYPGHGTVASTTQAGKFTVNVPYGGVFTLCFSISGGTFNPLATITVRGPRERSPFSPVVVAVGVAVTFEVEGTALRSTDSMFISTDSAQCTTSQIPVPPLISLSSTLVTTSSKGITFSRGGSYLVCYTVTGGPALPLHPQLQVKGPVSFAPMTINFGTTTDVVFQGLALSTKDTFRLVDVSQDCRDPGALQLPIIPGGKVQVNAPRGGMHFVCYMPFEGGFVALPTPLYIAGPKTATPLNIVAKSATDVAFTGFGLDATDIVKVVDTAQGCSGTALPGTEQSLQNMKATFTIDSVGQYLLCYKLQNATDFALFDRLLVAGVSSYSPTITDVTRNATFVLNGLNLDPTAQRLVISESLACPTAPPTGPSGLVGDNTTMTFRTSLTLGGANRSVCFWDGLKWAALSPPLTVLGPSTRQPVDSNVPYVAGASLQFIIRGHGLNGGFDRVRWSRYIFGSMSCGSPIIPDQQALVSGSGGLETRSPAVQLPGGRYIMCYAIGPAGEFMPVGDPLGGDPGGSRGEVTVAGPTGVSVVEPSTTPLRAGQPITMRFYNLQPSDTHRVRLQSPGRCTSTLPDDTMGIVGTNVVDNEIRFPSSSETTFFPLRGGTVAVCFKMAGGDYVALPLQQPNAVQFNITSANFTVQGPTTVGGVQQYYVAGNVYDIPIDGVDLASNATGMWWVPSGGSCMDPYWRTARTSTVRVVGTSTLQTTFHIGGEHHLCYEYPGDTIKVSRLGLPTAAVNGMFSTEPWTIPFGRTDSSISIYHNTTTPSADIWFWPQPLSATDEPGSEACPVPPTNAQRALLVSSDIGVAVYNTSNIYPGLHKVCVRQLPTANYTTLPYLVRVGGPTSFSPDAVTSPGTYQVTFTGINITQHDRVRLVPMGQQCDALASAAVEQSVDYRGVIVTPSFTTPANYTVCYQHNTGRGTGYFVPLATPFLVTGKPESIRITSPLPSTVVSMDRLDIVAQLVDASGFKVPRTGGTMALATDDSPGIPVPVEGDLSAVVTRGEVSFAIALGTAGVHRILLTYTESSTMPGNTPLGPLSVTSSLINVTIGPAAAIAADVSVGQVVSGEILTVPFQVVDKGYNNVRLSGVEVKITATPVSGTGQLLGTVTKSTNDKGEGVFDDLHIDKAGRYRLQLSATGGTPLESKVFEVVVSPSVGKELVISSQWQGGTQVTAGSPLSIDAFVRDWGDNVLYVDVPTTMFLTLADTPAPPVGARLSIASPELCASTSCPVFTEGVATRNGVAQFRNVWINKVGTYALQVSAPGFTATTNTITITEGPAHHLKVLESSMALNVGQTFSLSVAVRDLGGNIKKTSPEASVSVAAAPSVGATLQGSLTRVMKAGVAIFPDLRWGDPGVFQARFVHSTLGFVADSRLLYVETTPPPSSVMQSLLKLHLNIPHDTFAPEDAQRTAAELLGLSPDNVQVTTSKAGASGGTEAYLQLTGVEDANGKVATLADMVRDDDNGARSRFQGGAVLSNPEVVTAVPKEAAPSPDDGSGLSGTAIALIVVGIILFLLILAGIVFCMMHRRQRKKGQRGTKKAAGEESSVEMVEEGREPPNPLDQFSTRQRGSPRMVTPAPPPEYLPQAGKEPIPQTPPPPAVTKTPALHADAATDAYGVAPQIASPTHVQPVVEDYTVEPGPDGSPSPTLGPEPGVSVWLENAGMGKYASNFVGVSQRDLRYLTDHQLRSLGVDSAADRLQLLQAVRHM